jgi:hypothetical protein
MKREINTIRFYKRGKHNKDCLLQLLDWKTKAKLIKLRIKLFKWIHSTPV